MCPNIIPRERGDELEQKIYEVENLDGNSYQEQTPLIESSLKEGIFDAISSEPEVMNNNPVIQNFYNNTQASKIGSFYNVHKLIGQLIGETDQVESDLIYNNAVAINSSINPYYIFEDNQKAINNLLLAHKGLIQIINLSSSEKNVIELIANQCQFKGGKAVLEARSIVWKYNPEYLFDDDELCNDGSYFRVFDVGKENSTSRISELYPNPANSTITVKYNLNSMVNPKIEIYDMLGNILICKVLNYESSSSSIDISELANGVYAIRISANNVNYDKLKFTIIK